MKESTFNDIKNKYRENSLCIRRCLLQPVPGVYKNRIKNDKRVFLIINQDKKQISPLAASCIGYCLHPTRGENQNCHCPKCLKNTPFGAFLPLNDTSRQITLHNEHPLTVSFIYFCSK
jgi:hypothetical protein